MEDKQNKIIIGVAGGVIIILIALFAIFNNSTKVADSSNETFRKEGEVSLDDLAKQSSCPYTNSDKISLAKCLTEKGWTMYGAYWCPHCKAQKEFFGEEAFKFINYVECTEKTDLCNAKKVQGYPTWIVESTSTNATATSTL